MGVDRKEALRLLGFSDDEQEPAPSLDEVRRAFRRQALLWHPDKQVRGAAGSSPGAATDRTPTAALDNPVADATTTIGPSPATPTTPEEHFKRVAAAYHLLLHEAGGGATVPSASVPAGTQHPPTTGGATPAATAANGAGAATPGAATPAGDARAGAASADDDEQLADLLSADLLLEASRLRLSEFDLIFLHQRASGGASELASVWPDVSQSVEDIWRRIRRRVERRRRREAAKGSTLHVAGSSFSGPAASKWALLREFVTDMLGAPEEAAPAAPPPTLQTPAAESAKASVEAGVRRRALRNGRLLAWSDEQEHHSPENRQLVPASSAVATEAEGSPGRRGRLPPGFYWRWCRRLVAARLLFYIFFKA